MLEEHQRQLNPEVRALVLPLWMHDIVIELLQLVQKDPAVTSVSAQRAPLPYTLVQHTQPCARSNALLCWPLVSTSSPGNGGRVERGKGVRHPRAGARLFKVLLGRQAHLVAPSASFPHFAIQCNRLRVCALYIWIC